MSYLAAPPFSFSSLSLSLSLSLCSRRRIAGSSIADMERFLARKSPGSGRFLAVFASPQSNGSADFELHEDELFAVAESPKPAPPSPLSFFPSRNTNSTIASLRGRAPADGILASLRDDHRHSSFSSSSSARMIPSVPKLNTEHAVSVSGGGIRQQSAPVNVPVVPMRARRRRNSDEVGGEEDEMLPPHEIVARARAKESPVTTFSVLEGAGRTLKGRDLRQVRNAVWRKTGFLD